MSIKRTRRAVDEINYHFVWCPKFRRPVLVNHVSKRLDTLLRDKSADFEGEVISLEIMPKHVHLFGSYPPRLAPHQGMHRRKGFRSNKLRSEFPFLKSRLPNLWTRSDYVGTAGNVPAEISKHYIAEQKGK